MSGTPDDEAVEVRFMILKTNLDRLEAVADLLGETVTDAANRSFKFYEMLHVTPAGVPITWNDPDGRRREIEIIR